MGRYMRVMLTALLIVAGVLVFLPSGYLSAGGHVFNQSFEEGEPTRCQSVPTKGAS